MSDEIINKVANSGLVTIDLEELYPKGERVLFDIKPLLFHELILKEKDFRVSNTGNEEKCAKMLGLNLTYKPLYFDNSFLKLRI